jgi:hypothetical protein
MMRDVDAVRSGPTWHARLIAAIVSMALATAAACGPAPSTAPLPTPEVSCAQPRFDPPSTLTCAVAVAVATTVLPFLHPRLVSIEFGYGGWCPPNARCARVADTAITGHVIFTFVSGDPLLVHVTLDEATGAVSVTASGPLPSGS